MGTIIYGNEIASEIKAEIREKVELLKTEGKRIPQLAVILVGHDVGSTSYVKGKEKDCHDVGFINTTLRYEESVTEEELLCKIDELNRDAKVDGILVQLPLPKHINEHKVLFAIDPAKDVDGFHPFNIGKMMIGENTYLPCTPKGVMVMLEKMGFKDLSGKKAVVIGRSNIVGKPMAMLLLKANATVTVCHSKTKNLIEEVRQADIVIAAVGKAKFVKAEWLKEGAAVIDVGVNRNLENKLCGDVDFENAVTKVGYITPVPKGVGPMTRAMLMKNTLQSYEEREEYNDHTEL